jgi:hypothetical protein
MCQPVGADKSGGSRAENPSSDWAGDRDALPPTASAASTPSSHIGSRQVGTSEIVCPSFLLRSILHLPSHMNDYFSFTTFVSCGYLLRTFEFVGVWI